MSKAYWKLYYHVVWSTKGRAEIISPEVRDRIVRCIQAKCDELGCVLHAAEAAWDHVHILVTVPPDMSLSEFLRHVKGASSHLVNHEMNLDARFEWQRGYGLLTVSARDRAMIVGYIRDQRGKHKSGNLLRSLERCEEERGLSRLQPALR